MENSAQRKTKLSKEDCNNLPAALIASALLLHEPRRPHLPQLVPVRDKDSEFLDAADRLQ